MNTLRETDSRPFELSRDDLRSILRGAGLAVAGAVLTWAATILVPALQSGDPFEWRGLLSLLAAAVVSALVNTLRKYVGDNSTPR